LTADGLQYSGVARSFAGRLFVGVDMSDAEAVKQAMAGAPAVFDGLYLRAAYEQEGE